MFLKNTMCPRARSRVQFGGESVGLFKKDAFQYANSLLWSHWHWDHIGDPSRFPPSTDLIVGPGFKAALLPAFPTRRDSPVRESDFRCVYFPIKSEHEDEAGYQ